MGDLPARNRPIAGKKRSEDEREGYVLETWDLDLNGIETVPAYLARPKGATGRRPAVLFNHSHGGGYKIGKQEFIEGRSYLQPVPYASELTGARLRRAVDRSLGLRRAQPHHRAGHVQGDALAGAGAVGHDGLRQPARDRLPGASAPTSTGTRIATLGISMGSTMAWWLAALDERVKVTVDICCLTDFQTLMAKKNLSAHGVYYFVPGLLKKFSTAQINALIAPRAHLGLAGLQDKLTPVEGLDIIDAELKRVYAGLGHPERWKLLRYDVGHQETAEGRQEIVAFLRASVVTTGLMSDVGRKIRPAAGVGDTVAPSRRPSCLP